MVMLYLSVNSGCSQIELRRQCLVAGALTRRNISRVLKVLKTHSTLLCSSSVSLSALLPGIKRGLLSGARRQKQKPVTPEGL